MSEKDALITAYNVYTNVFDVIDMITDNIYLSVTDISRLLSCICEVSKVTSSIINQILLKEHIIIKQNRQIYKLALQDNKRPLKYIPTAKAKEYYKIKPCNGYSFLLWDFKFIFKIFNINFDEVIDTIHTQRFCNLITKYTGTNLKISDVDNRLKQLQLIFKKQSIYF